MIKLIKLLFTDTDSLTYNLKLKMHIKIFGVIRTNLIIVNIQKTLHISINQIKKFLESSKMKYQEFQLTLCVWWARKFSNAELPRPTAGEESPQKTSTYF